MNDIQSFNSLNQDFGVGGDESKNTSQSGVIHIRIQQRNGRKTLTTVQGIDPKYDLKRIIKFTKKQFACNGTVVDHPEYGQVIQYQGDQRSLLHDWLVEIGIGVKDQIKVHGF